MSCRLTFLEGIGLGKTKPEEDEEHGRTGTEPVQGSPGMRRRSNQGSGERGGEQVTKRIPLLKQTGHEPASLIRTILESGGGGISVHAAHGNPEEGPTGQELLVGVAEARTQFQGDEEEIVDDEGPLSAPAIRGDAENHAADRPKHQHQGYSPGDICNGLVELLRQLGCCQGDAEEVKRIPCPSTECDLYHQFRLHV